ncbi:glutamine-hydrolyzing carbamoyl-phosphate synthase small subunit [Bacteroides salyersiae]|uniref:glutamine-hydrolyzing carbamoyl-phosphate synthase small subunit n=1 Tax=Bacteroides salyersiae TaxID=291644 RepID=UPI001C8C7F8C|nr:glutamine-hydrolyzing carbamoyl-phosphate synthase small subunit [Bacteroides salyersiae]
MRNVTLILDDGSRFHGKSFGYEKPVVGEVVFNTAMTGYPESLTDPSYAGQLMTLTYPLVGNYGVPPFTVEPNGLATFMESEKIHAEAIIVSDYSEEYSHWNAVESLADWLKREQVPGITGIDTRELTKVLREHGVMMGRIVFDNGQWEIDNGKLTMDNYAAVNYVDRVSCKEIISYLPDGTSRSFSLTTPIAQLNCQLPTFNFQLKKVVLVDCGVKTNIIRCLLKRDVEVIRVPWDYDFNELEFDGLFISNGPGDPDTCDAAVQNIRKAMLNPKLPIFGICMGNQLLSKAGGAKIYKLKYGHRSHNQPVRMVGTERCFITSQNHGYAVDNNTLGADWEPLFINMNDGSNEGIRHKTNPWFSAQFHPEAASGPTDTEFLFDEFVNLLK